jgi:pantothenate kinase
MDIALVERASVWRGRGAPRREIPEQIRTLVDATYRSKKAARIDDITTDADREEARQIISLARSYAQSKGRRLRVSPYVWDRAPRSEEAAAITTVAFEMVDAAVPSPRKATP